MSQTALGRQVGVTREAVSAWESGRAAPQPDKILAIARALGVSNEAINSVAGKLLGRVGYLANVTVPPARLMRETPATWPDSVHILASRLETRILEAGGDRESAAWARRALLNPDAYIRFYRPGAPEKPEHEILAELEFMSDGLFYAATGIRPTEGKRAGRPRHSPRRGKA